MGSQLLNVQNTMKGGSFWSSSLKCGTAEHMVIKLHLVNIHIDPKEETYFRCDDHVTEVLHSLKE